MFFTQHDPPTHKCLFQNLVLGCVREYFQTNALTPFSLAPTSSDTTLIFIVLHYESDGFLSLVLEDSKPNQNLELSSYYFKLTFQCMLNLFANGPYWMVEQL
jgi:hypothetical protein